MESRLEKASLSASVDPVELAGHLVTQINYIIQYRVPGDKDDLLASLNSLSQLPTSASMSLLHICNEWGYSYAQMMASLRSKEVVLKYIELLDKLSQDGVAGIEIFELLRSKSRNGGIIGRQTDVETKQFVLNLLLQLLQREGPKGALHLSDAQALLEAPNNNETTFLDDIIGQLSPKMKSSEKQAHLGLVYFLLTHDLLSNNGYQLFAKFENDIRDYLVHVLPEEERVAGLKNALNTEHPLGKLFRFKHKSDVTDSLVQFRQSLHQIKPFEGDTISEHEISREISRSDVVSEQKKNTVSPRGWWGQWASKKSKPTALRAKKSAEKEDENDIPMKTFPQQEESEFDDIPRSFSRN
jgi:hypothetical protein